MGMGLAIPSVTGYNHGVECDLFTPVAISFEESPGDSCMTAAV